MTNHEFMELAINTIDASLDRARKEYTPTEKDAEELTKLIKGFENTELLEQLVGLDNLPQLKNIQNYLAESLETVNASKK
jgi:hypothetical protein